MNNDERWTGYWWEVVVGGVAICRVAVGRVWAVSVAGPEQGMRMLSILPWCRLWRACTTERLPS
jgi:hypothetical protein